MYEPVNILPMAKGKFYVIFWNHLCMYVHDIISGNLWKALRFCKLSDRNLEAKARAPLSAVVIDGELLGTVDDTDDEENDWKSFLVQSKGFSKQKGDVVWEIAYCMVSIKSLLS